MYKVILCLILLILLSGCKSHQYLCIDERVYVVYGNSGITTYLDDDGKPMSCNMFNKKLKYKK